MNIKSLKEGEQWGQGRCGRTLGAPAPRFSPLPPILSSVLVQNHGIRICWFGIFYHENIDMIEHLRA